MARPPRSRGPVLPTPGESVPPGVAARAWSAVRRIVTPPRVIVPTLEGWIFVALTVGVAAAALNTGNNLLYMVFALMLGLVALSGVLSESAIRRLRIERRLPAAVHAGQPAEGRLTARNPRRLLPSIDVEVIEAPGRRCDGGAEPVVFPGVLPGERESRPVRYRFRRRGLHRLDGFRVQTTFPFGLVRKWTRIAAPTDVLVYPEVRPLAAHAHGRGPGGREADSDAPGLDGDYLGLRDFVDGEDARRIHWKISARRGALVAVDRSREDRRAVTVYLLPGGDPGTPGFVPEFERTLSTAASVACALLQRGHQVGLVTPGSRLEPTAGAGQRHAILRQLALEPVPARPLAGPLRARRAQLGGRDVVVA